MGTCMSNTKIKMITLNGIFHFFIFIFLFLNPAQIL